MNNDQASGQSEINDMSENEETVANDLQIPDELSMLKQRARVMGIVFSNNIGLETLRQKVKQKLEEVSEMPAEEPVTEAAPNPLVEKAAPKSKMMSLRKHLMMEQMKLVRLRIQNLDPKKKNLPGEILTVANEYLGTVRKFIPYGEVTDGGYHVPYCLYEMMKEKTFVSIRIRKVNGRDVVETRDAKEFALEILPPLGPNELARLAQAQIAAGSLEAG